VAVAAGALCAGLVITQLPAYADVTSSYYTIGTPTGAVGSVVATPTSVSVSTSTDFKVSFVAPSALAGSSDSWVSISPSTDFASAPVYTSIDLVGGSCIQQGTDGTGGLGVYSVAGIQVELGSSCTIPAGSSVQVYFTVAAPATAGTFYFTVSTSSNSTTATSNEITVGTAGVSLSAISVGFGANTTYTLTGVPVAGLSASTTGLELQSDPIVGGETITFVSGQGAYTVTYTPSGGSPVADPVTAAVSTGTIVNLTLTTPIVNSYTLTITATGTNPAYTTATESDAIIVTPTGTPNGSSELTSTITFGNSVTAVTVSPSSTVASASTTYVVEFKATDAVSAGQYIFLTEPADKTNFSTVTGVLVADITHPWEFVASGSLLGIGSADVPLADAITAGDYITVTLANVTNPPAGTVSDFGVSTTGDAAVVDAAAFSIGTNASPGVVVTPDPSSVSAVAVYTISNVHVTALMTGGSSTLGVQAPPGTVFPNNAAFYSVLDATTGSGSGTVSSLSSGGGTNDVAFVVPENIGAGDVLTITIQDVVNPNTASATDSITLVGSVTGPEAVPTTTTTTTTTTLPKPVLQALTTKATVSKKAVTLKFSCTAATCAGTITLLDVRTVIAINGGKKYSLANGKTGSFTVGLNSKGMTLIAGAKAHTITAHESVTVAGGATLSAKVTLVG
jgi:hypothetical protein